MVNNSTTPGSQVCSQSCLGNLQDVVIHFQESSALTSDDPLLRFSAATNSGRRSSIQDRLGSPQGVINTTLDSSPHTQNRIPISLILGEREEESREVSLTRANTKRRVGRGGSTSRGRGRGRGKKAIPHSPLPGVGSKKRNVLRTQVPSKKKLCQDKQSVGTNQGPQDDVITTNLPLSEELVNSEPIVESSRRPRASTRRNQVDFYIPSYSLPSLHCVGTVRVWEIP